MSRLLQSKVLRPQSVTSSSSSSPSDPPPSLKKRVREDGEPASPAKKHRTVQMVDVEMSNKDLDKKSLRLQRRMNVRAEKKTRVERSKAKVPFAPNLKYPVDLTLMKFFISGSDVIMGGLGDHTSEAIGYKKLAKHKNSAHLVDTKEVTNFSVNRVFIGKSDLYITFVVDIKHGVVREMTAPVVMGKESGRSVTSSQGKGTPRLRMPVVYTFRRYDNNFFHHRLNDTTDAFGSYIQCYLNETPRKNKMVRRLRFVEDLFLDGNGNMRVHRFVGGSSTTITSFGLKGDMCATTTTLIGNGYAKSPLRIKKHSSIRGVSEYLTNSLTYSRIDGVSEETRPLSTEAVRRKVYQGFIRFKYEHNPSFPYKEGNTSSLYDAQIFHKRKTFVSFVGDSLIVHDKALVTENDQDVKYYSWTSGEKRLAKSVDKESGMVMTYDASGRQKMTQDEITTIFINDLFYSVTFSERELERISEVGIFLDVVYKKHYVTYADGVDYSRQLAGVIHNFIGARRVCDHFKELSMSHVALWNWISICRHYPNVRALFSEDSNSETYERFFLHRDFDQSNSALVEYADRMKIPTK